MEILHSSRYMHWRMATLLNLNRLHRDGAPNARVFLLVNVVIYYLPVNNDKINEDKNMSSKITHKNFTLNSFTGNHYTIIY